MLCVGSLICRLMQCHMIFGRRRWGWELGKFFGIYCFFMNYKATRLLYLILGNYIQAKEHIVYLMY